MTTEPSQETPLPSLWLWYIFPKAFPHDMHTDLQLDVLRLRLEEIHSAFALAVRENYDFDYGEGKEVAIHTIAREVLAMQRETDADLYVDMIQTLIQHDPYLLPFRERLGAGVIAQEDAAREQGFMLGYPRGLKRGLLHGAIVGSVVSLTVFILGLWIFS